MKSKHLLVSLLTIAMISIMISPMIMNANAEPVPQSSNSTAIVWQPGGQAIYLNMTYGDPQWLQLYTKTAVYTETTVIIDGRDALGANIEAEVVLPAGTISQRYFIFNDSTSGMPVAFSYIDNIYQQGGTDGVQFKIMTCKLPFPQYLGEYENTTGWKPGQYDEYGPAPTGEYYYSVGYKAPYGLQPYPDQPTHPEQLQVLIHWEDQAQPGLNEPYLNLIPDFGAPITEWPDGGAQNTNMVLTIEGLNEHGNKWTANVTIPYGATQVDVPMSGVEGGYGPIADCTVFATVCKVWGGGAGDSYYIFTKPQNSQDLFTYTIRADHLAIWPTYYDILAADNFDPGYSRTPVTVALEDADNNLVYAHADITMNFFTSGGTIIPSEGINADILNGTCTTTVTLTADTNARTIKVTADANVPAIEDLATNIPELNLFVWTNVVFDGINSVFYTGAWPIHNLQWGYTNAAGTVMGPFNVPPKPVLPYALGGPDDMGIKLDGPVYEVEIKLYVGCNLISSPVRPMMSGFYDGYPTEGSNDQGIPMTELFGDTSAITTIEAVWWYRYGMWFCYVPKTDTTTRFNGTAETVTGYFTAGQGYWIKAEKPCTLELSGILMENGPFTPTTDHLEANTWSLRGFTSVTGMSTTDYLESVNTGNTLASAVGPVWVYHADSGSWERDPAMLWPTQGMWVYNKVPQDLYIAP